MNQKALNKTCLILTGCIAPNQNVPSLNLKNQNERRDQYIDSIAFFIKETNLKKIVFCDNSNAEIDQGLYSLAEQHHKKFEWIAFQGDTEAAVAYGKGFGEGEIIKYVIEHSALLAECDFIVKVTGRLIIKNLNSILRFAKRKKLYTECTAVFDDGTVFLPTRFYMMPKEMYIRCFLNGYQKVRDKENIILEFVFSEIARTNGLKQTPFVITPEFIGCSGTSGLMIKNGSKIKGLLNIPRFYLRAFRNKCKMKKLNIS